MNQMLMNRTSGTSIVLTCLLLLVQTSFVWAAEDITGEWEIKMDFGGRERFGTMSISKKADGTLTGKWGSGELTDVKFEDGKLTFTRIETIGNQEFIMEYAGTLKDGKLTGTLSSDSGDTPANGTHKKPKSPALGQWDMKYNVGEREITGRLTILQKPDGRLAGKWDAEFGEHVVSNVKFQDGKLTYTRKSKYGDREFESNFEGTIKGHKLAGAFKSDRGEMSANGQRVGANLVGRWELTSTSERSVGTRMLMIYGDMTGRYETYGTETAVKDLKLEGNQVTFSVDMGFGDRDFKLDFKGIFDGKILKGEVTSESYTVEVVGKKAEVASPFVGTWEFTRETSRGTRTSILKIKEDMTATYTVRDNELAVTDLKVNGNQISFKVMMRYGDREVSMEFKGKVDGTTLMGERTTSRGTSKVTGKKLD